MTVSLNNATDNTGWTDTLYWDNDYLNYMRSFYSYFISISTVTPVTPFQAGKFSGDLYGLLNDLGIPAYLGPIIMLVNNFKSSIDNDDSLIGLLIPDLNEVEQIKNIYLSQ